jgi:hypothetical protein
MGYHTEFDGDLQITPRLIRHHRAYIQAFCESRRMKRDPDKIDGNEKSDVRILVGLPKGDEGAFCIGTGNFGQDKDASIIDYNSPPHGQPSLWCHWEVTEDGERLTPIDGKNYSATQWLQYLIDNFFKPWGYTLNGEVDAYGEDSTDLWRLVVEDNMIERWVGKVVYERED